MNRRDQTATTLACGLAGDVIRTFGKVRLRVFGASMVPSILPGDLITVQRAVASEISSGEIVLFAREGRMFAHRVVSRTDGPEQPCANRGESPLITRGDRLRRNDPPVSSSELLGRVISIERGNSQRRPAGGLTGWERMIGCLLRYSDHATDAYLRLAAFRLAGARNAMTLLGGSNERRRAGGSVKCRV